MAGALGSGPSVLASTPVACNDAWLSNLFTTGFPNPAALF
jgi:hypothetical protein